MPVSAAGLPHQLILEGQVAGFLRGRARECGHHHKQHPQPVGSARPVSVHQHVVEVLVVVTEHVHLHAECDRRVQVHQHPVNVVAADVEDPEVGAGSREFLTGPVIDVGEVQLPEPGPGSRLRWNLNQLHTALNEQRQERDPTWSELAQELGCTPSRLTNLRTARIADLGLMMRVTQWLGRPAAEFIHAAAW